MPFDGEEFDTTAVVQLTSVGRNFFPAWSPGGTRIAYSRSVCDGPNTCGIWLMELTNNVNEFLHSYGNFPHWHPFQDSIIFRTNALTESGQDIGDYLWIFSVLSYSKSLLRFIALPNQDNRYFKYSPDGRTIAFTSQFNTGEGTQLCRINSDGSDLRQSK